MGDVQQFLSLKGRDISPILLKQTTKDIEMTIEEPLTFYMSKKWGAIQGKSGSCFKESLKTKNW